MLNFSEVEGGLYMEGGSAYFQTFGPKMEGERLYMDDVLDSTLYGKYKTYSIYTQNIKHRYRNSL